MKALRVAAVSVLASLLVLLLAEAGARVYFFWKNGYDAWYLTMPFFLTPEGRLRVDQRLPGPPVEYRYGGEGGRRVDPCTGRTIVMTEHRKGFRGAAWPLKKPAGTLRILVLGGSTTYGVNNPDDATWPVFLEKECRKKTGKPVEVLNAGVPGWSLSQLLPFFSEIGSQYQPDLLIYYEGYNAANPFTFKDAHQVMAAWVRGEHPSFPQRLARRLYRSSMFFTYLVERTAFHRIKPQKLDSLLGRYEQELRELAQAARSRGVEPVFVLHVTRLPERPELRQIDLGDLKQAEGFVGNENLSGNFQAAEKQDKILSYRTQLFVEATRRVGVSAGVRVIDPRPEFLAEQGTRKIFCDEIHLTDEGNLLLARVIADQLAARSSGSR